MNCLNVAFMIYEIDTHKMKCPHNIGVLDYSAKVCRVKYW
jgi:hypothetical protein